MFEHFDHTADLGLRVRAPTLCELLADAGRGLLAMHVADPETVRPILSRTIELTADDPAYLLFDWLSELLYVFESEKLLLGEFDIELSQTPRTSASGVREHPDRIALPVTSEQREADSSRSPFYLIATCRGEIMDESRHTMDHEVKAITYHGLRVEPTAEGAWQAEVIVDI
jgi:SHS2 domain-containing protein